MGIHMKGWWIIPIHVLTWAVECTSFLSVQLYSDVYCNCILSIEIPLIIAFLSAFQKKSKIGVGLGYLCLESLPCHSKVTFMPNLGQVGNGCVCIYLFVYLSWEKYLKLSCKKCLTHPCTGTKNSPKRQNRHKMPWKFPELYCTVFHNLETPFMVFLGRFGMKSPRFSLFLKFSRPTQMPMKGVGLIGSLNTLNLWKTKTS